MQVVKIEACEAVEVARTVVQVIPLNLLVLQ